MMRPLPRALSALAIAGALALGLAGCGGADGKESASPTGPPATSAAPSPSAAAADDGDTAAYCTAIKGFTATVVGGEPTADTAKAIAGVTAVAPAEVKESWQRIGDVMELYVKYSNGGATPLASASISPEDKEKVQKLLGGGEDLYSAAAEAITSDSKARCGIDFSVLN